MNPAKSSVIVNLSSLKGLKLNNEYQLGKIIGEGA